MRYSRAMAERLGAVRRVPQTVGLAPAQHAGEVAEPVRGHAHLVPGTQRDMEFYMD